jgi:hypothetical protein
MVLPRIDCVFLLGEHWLHFSLQVLTLVFSHFLCILGRTGWRFPVPDQLHLWILIRIQNYTVLCFQVSAVAWHFVSEPGYGLNENKGILPYILVCLFGLRVCRVCAPTDLLLIQGRCEGLITI